MNRTVAKLSTEGRIQAAQCTYLIKDESSAALPREFDKLLQLLSLHDLASRVARIGHEDDLKTLRADILAKLIEIHMIFVLHEPKSVNEIISERNES